MAADRSGGSSGVNAGGIRGGPSGGSNPRPAATAPPGVERLAMPAACSAAAPLAFWPADTHVAATATPVQTPVAALVLPALGVPAGAYRRLAEALAAAGTPTGVAEWRGTGASPVRAARDVDWGYTDLLAHEVLGGIAALRARLVADTPVAIIGHSLGGHLGLMARAMAAPGLAGVFTVASGTPTLRFFAPKLRWLLRVVLGTHRLSGPMLGYFPGHRVGFGGRQPRTLMDEWALLARLGRFEIQGRNLLAPRSEQASRIPVHSLSLPQDAYAPRAATEHLLQLAGVDGSAVERFQGARPLGHFDWLKEPGEVAQRAREVLGRWRAV